MPAASIGQPGWDRAGADGFLARPAVPAPGVKLTHLGEMTLGMVPTSSLLQRGENYKAMTEAEFGALRASMKEWGFQGFIAVRPGAVEGTWEVIDGHHRWDAAEREGRAEVPILVLPEGATGKPVDLAALTFNVTGTPQGARYLEMLREVTAKVGASEAATFTAVGQTLLAEILASHTSAATAAAAAAAAGAGAAQGLGTPPASAEEPGADRSRGSAITVLLPNNDATRALLVAAQGATGHEADGVAVLVVLRYAAAHADAVGRWVRNGEQDDAPPSDASTQAPAAAKAAGGAKGPKAAKGAAGAKAKRRK